LFFFALAILGLFFVKWSPYYAKGFVAAQNHTLGASIVSGNLPASPAIGWQAGLDYSIAYLKAIWQALLLGLALGAGAALRLVVGVALVFVVGNLAARVVSTGWQPHGAAIRPDNTDRPFLLAWGSAFFRLAVRLIPEYAILVFALGMSRAWFFPAMTPDIGHAFWLTPALAAAGTLFVIPTAGEVPIIQVLQQFGLGGAGAAALLITLPAVSLPSLAMLARTLPMRAIIVLGFGTFVFGLIAAAAAAALGLS
jgi:uncharacterized membrane protein YraQ (UPF0718 family)